jgi:hypothetical protein
LSPNYPAWESAFYSLCNDSTRWSWFCVALGLCSVAGSCGQWGELPVTAPPPSGKTFRVVSAPPATPVAEK